MKITPITRELYRADIIVNKAFDANRVYLVISVDHDHETQDFSVICRYLGKLSEFGTALHFPAQESMATFYLSQMEPCTLEFS